MEKFLSLSEFMATELEKAEKVFESKVWTTKDEKGAVIPGKLKYRIATVGDREVARQAAKNGDKFDNATYGVHLIALCLIEPKVPAMDAVQLRAKNAAEMDRLLDAILEGDRSNPR